MTFFGGAIDETDTMVAEVEDAGVPDARHDGDEVSAAMLRALRTLPADPASRRRARARRLPVDKPAQFTQVAQTLGAGFRDRDDEARDRCSTTLGKRYKAPELTQAANADATCRDLAP